MPARTRARTKRPALRLAFVSSELAPLVQTGGLGDAVAGLARALAARGHEVHCVLPAHAAAEAHPLAHELAPAGRFRLDVPGELALDGSWRTGPAGPWTLHLARVGSYFDRPEIYGSIDDGARYVAFARAAAQRCAELEPDVVVAHDWQAALTICLLRTLYDRGTTRRIGTVQVVHNNAHQGRFPGELMGATGLPGELFASDGLECYGELSLLKGGLGWADRIVAVSPRYAEELQAAPFGEGLEGLYRFRADCLRGIANGIDTESYDPAKDAALPAQFDRRAVAGRTVCREALLTELGLETPEPGWLLACVGRLAEQKGWDLLVDAAEPLLERGAAFALLGDGDPTIAGALRELAARWPGRVAFQTGWNDGLARRIYAGADSVLVPSRFEPCGLVQLLGQRYGALPIAHAVGGLCDTIEDDETGILFSPLTVEALVDAVQSGARLRQVEGDRLAQTLLSVDVSWKKPARRWEAELVRVASEAEART